MNELLKRFRNPEPKHRNLLFWAWNSRLDEDELIRQIREMYDAGIGGFFMHSRDGLETVYMGDEWKRMIRSAVTEAQKLGMEAWLYDEDRWPSGTAGGLVPALRGDEARCKGLTLEVGKPGDWTCPEGALLALFAGEIRDGELASLRRLPLGKDAMEGGLRDTERLLCLRLEVSGKSEWFNGEAPPDNLNPRGVRFFIERTHEAYRAVAGDFFGKTIPGIFTDEPSLHDRHAVFPANRGWIPWTYGFGDYFIERRGYDPLNLIPWLYFNGEKSPKIRHDYWRTITERYAESYSGEISRWCRKNGIAYTGHFLQEDKLGLASRVNGGIMVHYRFQDIPGIDMLREAVSEYLTVKQCSSVAHQYGKRMVLSETYGCTGWEFSLEGQKWIGDWLFALGVNRLTKHMALYTLKGCGKRDYPPSFNYNTPWWKQGRIFEDYCGRITSILGEGMPVRDVLVLHPASTAWSRLGCSPWGNPKRSEERDVPGIDRYGYELNDFLRYLSGFHYDYDLGDEILLSRDGRVRDGSFVVGEAPYRVVILPPMDTLLGSTLDLLTKFLDAGGSLIAVKPLPFMVEGEASEKPAVLLGHPRVAIAGDALRVGPLLEDLLPRRASVTGPDGFQDGHVLCFLAELGDMWCLFLANNDRYRRHPVKVSFPAIEAGAVRRLDPLNGETAPRPLRDGAFTEDLGPADSGLYLIEKKGAGILFPEDASSPALFPSGPGENSGKGFYASFSPECIVRRNMPNTLSLDKCRWRFEGGQDSLLMEVWQAQEEIRQTLDMPSVAFNGITQRYRWVDQPHRNDGKPVVFSFPFTAAYAAEQIDLILEDAREYTLFLNGREVPRRITGWFLDRGFDRLSLPPLREGENLLELSCGYRNRMQTEDIYLAGDFSVDTRRRIVPENTRIRTGDWTLQGYPHYAGSLTYVYTFPWAPERGEGLFLELEDFVATAIILRVNGREYPLPWKAVMPVDITGALVSEGENRLEVEVLSSPRNLLGPFHLARGKTETTHDGSFRARGAESIEGYHFHPYGLYAPPRLYLKDKI
ncbi:MAG: hypothetical protein LBT93_04545 [Treponema sp.]|nr:hypothetical protein [Treponema sp.]